MKRARAGGRAHALDAWWIRYEARVEARQRLDPRLRRSLLKQLRRASVRDEWWAFDACICLYQFPEAWRLHRGREYDWNPSSPDTYIEALRQYALWLLGWDQRHAPRPARVLPIHRMTAIWGLVRSSEVSLFESLFPSLVHNASAPNRPGLICALGYSVVQEYWSGLGLAGPIDRDPNSPYYAEAVSMLRRKTETIREVVEEVLVPATRAGTRSQRRTAVEVLGYIARAQGLVVNVLTDGTRERWGSNRSGTNMLLDVASRNQVLTVVTLIQLARDAPSAQRRAAIEALSLVLANRSQSDEISTLISTEAQRALDCITAAARTLSALANRTSDSTSGLARRLLGRAQRH